MNQIVIGEIVIPYELKISTRAQRITIYVRQGQVKVSVPVGVAERQVQKFILSKQQWIYKYWQQFQEQQILRDRKIYKSGQIFPYRGRNLTIEVGEHGYKTIGVSLIQDNLWINFPVNAPLENRPYYIKKALVFWCKKQARQIFRNKLDHYAGIMGVKYKTLRIKEQKTKWGSCSAQGNINLNWKVIMAPDIVIDYLIIHELAHLKYLNHSRDFWDLVADYMEDYKQWRKWLKDHGGDLEV
ncbi:MAG: SprT family zinc-dependent metalloprotease [Desulfitobacteriaceae bacterium]|nr:SprT family zinc-dependent metalloprotease [Desulfitobacteriaceae bacterium]MDD4345815.1 SprT family zinc-dependent metalloprotease [Desulfitobacteriaceae bacterium]MDD4400788.1 SprT family zinc-dependent metalloprotease [Desulfitobacteriaceae bacterium]